MITINQFLKCIHLQQQWASLSSIIPPSTVLLSVFFNQLFSVALRQTIQICSSSVFLCSVHLYLWCLWTLLPSTSPSIMAFSRLLMYGVTIVPCLSHFYFLQQNHVAFLLLPPSPDLLLWCVHWYLSCSLPFCSLTVLSIIASVYCLSDKRTFSFPFVVQQHNFYIELF